MPEAPRPDVPAGSPPRGLRLGDPGYPAGLRDLPDPPLAVYVRGGPLPALGESVAIVGSRAASGYGRAQAERLAGDLARLGLAVVSGLARGIDAAAHRGALEAGGRTVAVLPAGLGCITPRHHRDLAAEIAGRGALLTEIEPCGRPWPGAFVRRNRLIAALAAATVVVEAAERSGALSTAAAARRLGRPLLAVPGDVDRETSRGCHGLLRRGARLCEGAGDVLAVLSPAGPRAAVAPAVRPQGAASGAQGPQARVLAVLDRRPRTVDELAAACGLGVGETLSALLALEWAEVARPEPGQRWVRAGA